MSEVPLSSRDSPPCVSLRSPRHQPDDFPCVRGYEAHAILCTSASEHSDSPRTVVSLITSHVFDLRQPQGY